MWTSATSSSRPNSNFGRSAKVTNVLWIQCVISYPFFHHTNQFYADAVQFHLFNTNSNETTWHKGISLIYRASYRGIYYGKKLRPMPHFTLVHKIFSVNRLAHFIFVNTLNGERFLSMQWNQPQTIGKRSLLGSGYNKTVFLLFNT